MDLIESKSSLDSLKKTEI